MLSLMDKHYKADMSLEEALELVEMCLAEVKQRLVVAPPKFLIKIVDKNGTRTVERPRAAVESGSTVQEHAQGAMMVEA